MQDEFKCDEGNRWEKWGADRDSMLTIYQALIRSTIDYGCMIYGSAIRKHY